VNENVPSKPPSLVSSTSNSEEDDNIRDEDENYGEGGITVGVKHLRSTFL
jgi:hypothetical protein